jgi:hypothetical protein
MHGPSLARPEEVSVKAAPDPNGMTFPHGFLDFLAPCPTARNKLDEYEIDPDRLVYFNGVLRQISGGDYVLNMDQIITAAKRVLGRYQAGQRPVFVESRLQALRRLEEMASNQGWQLAEADQHRIARLRAYVEEPEGLLPDALPVIGQLDDALLIDVAVQVLHDELADYEDYCRFCQVAADFAAVDIAEVHLSRAQWCQALSQAYDGAPRRQTVRYAPDIRVSLFHIH